MKSIIELLYNKKNAHTFGFNINELVILNEFYLLSKKNKCIHKSFLKKDFPLIENKIDKIIIKLIERRLIFKKSKFIFCLTIKGKNITDNLFYTKDEYIFQGFVEYVKLHELNLKLELLNYELIKEFYKLTDILFISHKTKELKKVIYKISATLIRFAFNFNLNTKWGENELILCSIAQKNEKNIENEVRGIFLLQKTIGEIGEIICCTNSKVYDFDKIKKTILNGFKGLSDIAKENNFILYESLEPYLSIKNGKKW